MQNRKWIKWCILGGLVSGALPAVAAEAITPAVQTNILSNLLLYTGIAVVAGGLLALWSLYNAVADTAKKELLQELGIEEEQVVEEVAKEPWWKTQYRKWTNVVPVEREQDVMMHHDYDGIHELDNSLPPWWVAMFYITIVTGVIYFAYYHVTDYGLSSREEYALEMEEAATAVKEYLASQTNTVDETNVEMIEDAQQLALGQTLFVTYCAACHGNEGGGGVGPNLTDNYWLHGGSIKDVFKTIKYGVPEKGMIAWKAQLRPADIHRVSAYIQTLAGTSPPNPKEPQGVLYEGEEVQQDSLSNEAIGLLNQ